MSNVPTTYWQAGIESTLFTPVAADRIIYELGGIPEEQRPKEYIQQSRAMFVENFDAVETHALVDFTLEAPAISFNDLAWWNQLALKGGVTPTGAGPYVWTSNGVASTDNLDAATFEVADQVSAFQIPGCRVNAWEWAGKGGNDSAGLVTGKYDLIGQKLTPGHTMTTSLTDRDLVGTYIPFIATQFYLDNAAGGIGGTEIGTLLEFSLKMDNKQSRLIFGGDSGYAGGIRRETRYLEWMVKLLLDSTSYSEFTNKFRTNTVRYIQFKWTGSGSNSMVFNVATKPEKFEWPEDGPTRQVALMGRSLYDPTLGYDWQCALTNSVASI